MHNAVATNGPTPSLPSTELAAGAVVAVVLAWSASMAGTAARPHPVLASASHRSDVHGRMTLRLMSVRGGTRGAYEQRFSQLAMKIADAP